MFRLRSVLVALFTTVLWALPLQAQQPGTISGRIVDASLGGPVADVEVRVGNRTVLSGADGTFLMANVPPGNYTLRVNRLGYRSVEQPVTVAAGQTTTVEISLEPAPVGLEGLVAIGYGERQVRDLTGVVQEVSLEEFNTGRIVSAEELIRGKVAGVQVAESNGGEPGGGISIRIRGGTSVTSSNDPLYVIDGVPVPVGGGLSSGRNPMNFLNPDDIQSVTVLKDASATAIYGSQGANGVVIIATKSGQGAADGAGARVTYRGNISGSAVVGRPDILSAEQFRQVVADEAPTQVALLGNASTDWADAVDRNAFGQEHTVAVVGGGDKMNYRLSLGYLEQEGVILASKNERITANLSYNQLLFDDRLSLTASLVGSRVEDQFDPGVVGGANNFAPTQPIRDPSSPFGGFFEWADPLGTNNPIAQIELVTNEGTTYRSLGNLTGEYDLPWVDGLTATGRLGYLVTSSERRYFAPSVLRQEAETGNNGTVSRSNPTEIGYLSDWFLTYARSSEQHAYDVTGGYSYQQERIESPSFFAQQLSSDLLGPGGIPSADLERTSLFVDESRLASWFGRINYSYLDRYLITASVRADGSSKFGPGNQWGTFPSAAVAWRMSEESFMDGWEDLSDLKLRISWGKNGNQAFSSYQQYKDYVFGDPLSRVQFGNDFVSTIRPSAADPNIKWEETTSWNFGFDYGFWNNRLAGSLEYYTKDTDDLIFDVIVAGGTNLSNVVTTNVGSMNNKGVELTINGLIAEGAGDGFGWDASFNFAYNKNELTRINPFAGGGERILAGPFISGGVGSTVQVLEPGQPVNSFFLYEHIRDDDGNPIYADMNNDGTINEQDLYVDINEDGTVNFDDRVSNESPAPSWLIGHTSQMRYRGFDLGFTALAQLGNYVYNNVASSTGFYDQLRDQAAPSNLHSSVLENNFQTPQYFSDVYLEDASFLRLENIELGYTFQNRFNGLRLYGVIQNVFTITGYSGLDPTATITGIDNNIYPRTRTFTAGVSVGF